MVVVRAVWCHAGARWSHSGAQLATSSVDSTARVYSARSSAATGDDGGACSSRAARAPPWKQRCVMTCLPLEGSRVKKVEALQVCLVAHAKVIHCVRHIYSTDM